MYTSPDIFTDGADMMGSQSSSSAYDEAMFHINSNCHFDREIARAALHDVLTSDTRDRDVRLGALLMGSAAVATPASVAGFIDAIGEFEGKDLYTKKPMSEAVPADEPVVGCAGSGKKGFKTINITTPAMIIAASAGAYTLKAGSRSTSSLTGSTDILESVGFHTPITTESAAQTLADTGFGFYSIEDMIPKFDAIYGGKFFAPHALSLALPAILIPVVVDSLYYGYSGPNVLLSANTLLEVGYKDLLACGNTSDGVHYIDEITTQGTTTIAGARNGVMGNSRRLNAQEFFGLGLQQQPSIRAGATKLEQTDVFKGILMGDFPDSVAENTICVNAATIMYLAQKTADPREGFGIAREMIRGGAAQVKLKEIVEASRDNAA